MECIWPNTPLFLQDLKNAELHGIFTALTPAMRYIDPHAWTQPPMLSPLPVQVSFEELISAPSILNSDPEVRKEIFAHKISMKLLNSS